MPPHPEYAKWIERMSQRPAWAELPQDHPEKAPTIHQYRRDRLAAILSDDDRDLTTYLDKYGLTIQDNLEHYRHTMRINLPKVPADTRARSLEWLRTHEYDGVKR